MVRLNSRLDVGVNPTSKVHADSQSVHTDQARFLESEAGKRAQSDNGYALTLVLMGSSHGKTDA
jgi:hypothetical protein